jgi:hypothetical protein
VSIRLQVLVDVIVVEWERKLHLRESGERHAEEMPAPRNDHLFLRMVRVIRWRLPPISRTAAAPWGCSQ